MNNNNLNIIIKSCLFKENNALNGAALYINSNSSIINKNNSTIDLIDTKFIKNKSNYFGGSIFVNYTNFKNVNMYNLEFTENYAYAGGAIYINYFDNKNILLNTENIIYTNNSAESYGNDYATQPYIIKSKEKNERKELFSGDSLPLEFELYDNFDQQIKDVSKIYSNIIINVVLDKENEYNDDDINMLQDNSCFFNEGKYIYILIIIN